MPLNIEINEKFVQSKDTIPLGEGATMMFTPPINEDYWLFRVKLFEDQAIVGFPKFGTIGIGFAQEEDWNTNLPYTCDAEQIYDHIKHNKQYEQIADEQCLEAIKLIQKCCVGFSNNQRTNKLQ
jgi:hypothetical protein